MALEVDKQRITPEDVFAEIAELNKLASLAKRNAERLSGYLTYREDNFEHGECGKRVEETDTESSKGVFSDMHSQIMRIKDILSGVINVTDDCATSLGLQPRSVFAQAEADAMPIRNASTRASRANIPRSSQ